MFLAIGLVLPLLTGQIQQIGNMLLPMHLPVLLCGLICGWQYGGIVGFITPLLRHVIFGMPPMPNAISMAFELAAYGIVIGLCFALCKRQNIGTLYISLLTAMVAGRLIWGGAQMILLGFGKTAFTFQMFLSGALLTAVPGIILQLVLIPVIMTALDKTGVLPFKNK